MELEFGTQAGKTKITLEVDDEHNSLAKAQLYEFIKALTSQLEACRAQNNGLADLYLSCMAMRMLESIQDCIYIDSRFADGASKEELIDELSVTPVSDETLANSAFGDWLTAEDDSPAED